MVRKFFLKKEDALSGVFPIATGYPPPLNGLNILYMKTSDFYDEFPENREFYSRASKIRMNGYS
jgi:hypothetical protein